MHPVRPTALPPLTRPGLRPRLLRLPATVALLALAAAASAQPLPEPPPLATVPELDLPRYLGHWHEIARYPNRFQRDCATDTRAEYRLRPDGQVQVINRCRRADGSEIEAQGVARQTGDARSPRLAVRFAPDWLAWLPAVWGDYWVVDLDEGYQLAAVSEPGRDYLWVLSRTAQVAPEAWFALLDRLGQQGFDTTQLKLSHPAR